MSATTRRNFYTAGIGYGFGPLNTSVTYGQIFDTNSDFDEATGLGDAAYNLVFSADYALAPGLVLAGDVSWFDNDVRSTPAPATRAGAAVGSVSPGLLSLRPSRDGSGGASAPPPFACQESCCNRITGAMQERRVNGGMARCGV